jgi:hypothetical protein
MAAVGACSDESTASLGGGQQSFAREFEDGAAQTVGREVCGGGWPCATSPGSEIEPEKTPQDDALLCWGQAKCRSMYSTFCGYKP